MDCYLYLLHAYFMIRWYHFMKRLINLFHLRLCNFHISLMLFNYKLFLRLSDLIFNIFLSCLRLLVGSHFLLLRVFCHISVAFTSTEL